MNTEQKLQQYKDWVFRLSAYNMALAIIGIDKLTVAPAGGSEYRDKRTAFLAGELFTLETDPEMIQILKELKDDESIDGDDRRAITLYYQNTMKTMCIPKDEFVEARELMNQSYDAWLEAKTKNDYTIFEPYLKKVIETQKKFYGYRDCDMPLYDQMLDDFEPGMNQEKYDVFFDALKERLVPLIQKVVKAEQIDDSFLYRSYPVEEQKKFHGKIQSRPGSGSPQRRKRTKRDRCREQHPTKPSAQLEKGIRGECGSCVRQQKRRMDGEETQRRKKGKGRVCEKGWPVNDADRLVGKKICRVPWTGLRESIWSKAF